MGLQLPAGAASYEFELATAGRLAIAGLVGLAVGIEREWSGHASGPHGRFAGLRTFLLLGLLGGGAGLFMSWGLSLVGVVLLVGGTLFVVAAYVMAVRRPDHDLEATTEGAGLVVLMLGALAGVGQLAIAAGTVAVVLLALGEKQRLHWFVKQIGEREMRAGLQFLVLALVILPLLPSGPYGPYGGIRPRALWSVVVLFSGLNFAGYLARRAVGAARGYGMTGLLGGLVSSTAVTLQFARLSRRDAKLGGPLALGVIGACTVLVPRVLVTSAVLDGDVALALLPYALPPLVIGLAVVAIALRRTPPVAPEAATGGDSSPLRLWSAMQMALAFQVAITAVAIVRERWGSPGVLASAALLGLTNMDALTVSMSRLGATPGGASLGAQGIAVGLLATTVFKAALAIALGSARFRRLVVGGLTAEAAALGVGLWLASAL